MDCRRQISKVGHKKDCKETIRSKRWGGLVGKTQTLATLGAEVTSTCNISQNENNLRNGSELR